MADDLHTLVVGREAMACRFEVACNAGEFAGDTELAIEALDLVDRIEDRISIYRPDSELSRINALAAEGWVDVAGDIWPLLARSRELWELTGGAFDIAAGALVRAAAPARRGRGAGAALAPSARRRWPCKPAAKWAAAMGRRRRRRQEHQRRPQSRRRPRRPSRRHRRRRRRRR